MKFLIVDPNQAYSWTVKDFIHDHMPDAEVYRAENAAILRRRVAEEKFDILLVDIINAVDAEEMVEVLETVEAPIIMWSLINPGGCKEFAQKLHAKLLQKPKCGEGLNDLMELVGCTGDQDEQHREIRKAIP